MSYTKTDLSLFKSYHPPVKVGSLYIISGPSGVGKTTIINRLLEQQPRLEKIVAYTTRAIRRGEVLDKTYHYIGRKEFERKIQHNDFLEYMEFSGNFYGFGMTKAQVLSKLNAGINLIVDLDYKQVADLKGKIPYCHSIFIMPPSVESLISRLNARGDSKETVEKRMSYAQDIMEHAFVSDTMVFNYEGKMEEAVQSILKIINSRQAIKLEENQSRDFCSLQ
jgi:guanylate kinase